MSQLNVKITFTEEVLGTTSGDPELFDNFIASKAPNAKTREEEIANYGAENVAASKMTVFNKQNGVPFLYDYQIKGFFKDACSMLARVAAKDENGKKIPCNESSKLKAYKKVIDGMIFVQPRKIMLDLHGKELGNCQRPLRAQTMQGERVTLASSETAPAGTTCSFTIMCLSDEHLKAVEEWLNYGRLRGIGQWRNGSKGTFIWSKE